MTCTNLSRLVHTFYRALTVSHIALCLLYNFHHIISTISNRNHGINRESVTCYLILCCRWAHTQYFAGHINISCCHYLTWYNHRDNDTTLQIKLTILQIKSIPLSIPWFLISNLSFISMFIMYITKLRKTKRQVATLMFQIACWTGIRRDGHRE